VPDADGSAMDIDEPQGGSKRASTDPGSPPKRAKGIFAVLLFDVPLATHF
jgi:hypothetical protein